MNDLSELVLKAKNGVQSAFTRLYELTKKDVWLTCISLVKHEENAKDVFQNTYITAFTKIHTLEDNNNFSNWIKIIAVNKCKDFFKSKVEYQLEDDYMKDFVETDELTIPEEYITKTEKRKIILHLMEDTLSYVQYQTVFMHYFDNMAVADIAQVLECSEGTVKSRLNSARNKLRTAITDYESENNDRLHGVVFIPLFSSIFKEQCKNIKVPEIKIVLPNNQGTIGTVSKSIKTIIKGTGKGVLGTMKSRVITAICLLAVVSGASTSTAMLAGCNENKETTSIVSTTNATETDTTTATLNDTDQAIIDAGLNVDDKGNIVDENGNKVEVSEDGTVEVKTENGETIKVDAKEITNANTNNEKVNNSTKNKNDSSKNSETDVSTTNSSKKNEATTKPTEKSNNSDVKATKPTTKATQPTTKATQPATVKPTEKPTQAPTQKPTEAPTEAPEIREVVRCNDCNADLTDLYFNDMYAFDVHLYNHIMEGGKGSYRLTWEY